MDDPAEPQRPWRVSMGKAQPWRTSPWCPSPEDGQFLIEATRDALAGVRPTLLVLGTTPETVRLGWPDATELIAVDFSVDMIAMDWQPHPSSNMVQARWQQMPLGDGSVDAAVGDASLNALPDFDHYAAVLSEVARVLKPGGVLAVRMFLRGEQAETCEQVVDQAAQGAFANGVPFRLRFAMAAAGPAGLLELAQLPPPSTRSWPIATPSRAPPAGRARISTGSTSMQATTRASISRPRMSWLAWWRRGSRWKRCAIPPATTRRNAARRQC